MQKTIGRQSLFSNVLAIMAMVPFIVAPLAAQDTSQTSSGELKDFRLDNPPPKDKDPEPAPKQDGPVVQQQGQETGQPRPAQKSEAPPKAPVRRNESRAANAPASENSTAETAKSASELPPPTSTLPEAVTAETSAAVATPAIASAEPATDYRRYWPIFAAVLAALLGLALLLIWRQRRGTAETASGENPNKKTISSTPTTDADHDVSQPTLQPVTRSAPQPIAREALAVQFTPEKARLSVANLTIMGRLHLHNSGKKPLGTLRLRTLMISACDGQKDIINSFHSDPQMGQINSLSAVAPGEEIKMKLELQLPRDALQAFDWRERRFVAPIVLIHIDSEHQAIDPVRITSLVGQDGGPGSVRLQPIPVDRGPKLFDGLQFRPIAA